MDRIGKDELVALILAVASDMIAAKDELNTLDGAIGDGDLGITMTLGFKAIEQQIKGRPYDDLQAIFVVARVRNALAVDFGQALQPFAVSFEDALQPDNRC